MGRRTGVPLGEIPGLRRFPAAGQRQMVCRDIDGAGRQTRLADEERTEILDIRADAETMARSLDFEHYFPGYHMNKRTWLTVRLDGSVTFGNRPADRPQLRTGREKVARHANPTHPARLRRHAGRHAARQYAGLCGHTARGGLCAHRGGVCGKVFRHAVQRVPDPLRHRRPRRARAAAAAQDRALPRVLRHRAAQPPAVGVLQAVPGAGRPRMDRIDRQPRQHRQRHAPPGDHGRGTAGGEHGCGNLGCGGQRLDRCG